MRLVSIFGDSPECRGMRDEHGDPFVGGLCVFEVDSKQRAMELVERGPYFVSHLRHDRLLIWGKALSEHQVTL
jgi:hypothetical protein